MLTPWGSLHTHTRCSAKDALDPERVMVEAAVAAGWGAIGITDHGTVAGCYQALDAAMGTGIKVLPGIEAYINVGDAANGRPTTRHLCIVANTNEGFENLVLLSNASMRAFKYKPLVSLELLSEFGPENLRGLTAMTGCWFGLVQTALRTGREPLASWTLASNMLKGLQSCFGEDHVLVELQHHNISDETHDDEDVVALMDSFARKHGAPTVITTDSHYAHENDRLDHETLKRMMSWSDDLDDAVFPGDGYWVMPERRMRRRFEPDVWSRAMDGYRSVVDAYDLEVPALRTFTPKLPKLRGGEDPDEMLQARLDEALDASEADDRLREVCAQEMEVIRRSGFSAYLLLTAEVTDYCREHDIRYLVRGSASNSAVCWMLGITSFDPIEWKLDFSRFLSTDRTKPPDVDIDVRGDRRAEVLEHLASRYSTSHIGTWRELTENEEEEDDKGSLWVKWHIMQRKSGDTHQPDDATRERIASLSRHRAYDGVGMHAAGIVIYDSEESRRAMPMQWIASSRTMVTALDKDMVERLGYLKLDVLGLKTLTAVAEMERTTGVSCDVIPLNNKAVYQMIGRGDTAGVFQLSGFAQRKGLPKLKPKRMEDIVIAMALFRPACIKSGAMAEFLDLRNKRVEKVRRHTLIEQCTTGTNGLVLFQEQVLAILRGLGLDVEQLNAVLKAVKASNEAIGDAAKKMDTAIASIKPLMDRAGFNRSDEEWMVNALRAYAAYGFNRGHAVSYAHMAYWTAWFKEVHPLDYWAATLNVAAGSPKYEQLLTGFRSSRVRVLPAHVNKSEGGWTIDRDHRALRKGLSSIEGVGPVAAAAIAEHAPYTSLEDIAKRCPGRAVTGSGKYLLGASAENAGGVIAALWASTGALRHLPERES